MIADRWRRTQELFDEALTHPPKEQASFVAEACGDDAELRAEVESLLAQDREASADFMRPPEPDPGFREHLARTGIDPLIGKTVGGYHIKSVIASGGMGTVYEAVQNEPHRVVALKVMKRNVASRSALRRFQFEAQILGRLRHPNVAQIYDAGMHDDGSGRVPYFAMEYIPGARDIIRYAKEKELGTREVLALFCKACEAVHHGHQKGIIHRDLKPANILVDSAGEPKVIDFGVARATDSDLAITTQQTCIGQLVGTMQYMSPEQCDADPHDLDIRSDVYSLGVVLYELLTGELPYDASSGTVYQGIKTIIEDAPRKPSSVDPKLPGDAEAIVLMALAKDREKRYQSAADLAQDIRRYLNREPIEAKPPTAWTRAVRWVSRHPVFTTGILTFLATSATIFMATLLTTWHVNARPHRIRLTDDHREARLFSIIGGILHTWSVESRGGITFAELVEQPPELGGRQLAVIGYSAAPSNPFPCSLCAYDVGGDRENPVWHQRIEQSDMPRALRLERGFDEEQFGIAACKIVDVFPDRAGDEIVALHQHERFSHTAIRVYDEGGNVLYQVWHDGRLKAPYWMSDARLLVFTGCAKERWDELGYTTVNDLNPVVVFAVRPKSGLTVADYLRPAPGEGRLSPVWYWYLLPPEALNFRVRYELKVPVMKHGSERFVDFYFGVQNRNEFISWTIDQFGQEVPETRVVSDHYKRNKTLPDPNVFHLGPLPPIVSNSDGAEESPDEDGR